ncbi:MAG: hypothetical protein MUE69_22020 [Myxococcota bacterium]|nr:hypothetical protein [Myxococcota bacterium]
MRAWLGIGLLVMLGACGARSALVTGEELDGSLPDGGRPDGALDAGRDAPPPFDGGTDSGMPFELVCSEPISARPGVPVTISASVVTGSFVRGTWSVAEQPMGSSPEIEDPGSTTTPVKGDLPGRYRYVFEAVDSIGQVATCESVVAVVAGPPVAVCPSAELVAPVDTELTIPGAGFDDDGEVQFAWTVASSPRGSFTSLNPVDVAMPVFLGDTAGRYVVRLVVTDVFGMTDTCDARVRLTAPPVIDCPSEPLVAPTRQPLTVRLNVTDDTSIARHDWEILVTPPRTTDLMLRPSGSSATLTPERQGPHELLYRATDTDGLTAECIVTVLATPTPPTLMCPEVVEGRPLTTITWTMGVQDDGFTSNVRWMLASRPDGSAAAFTGNARIDTPGMLPFAFEPDLAGEFPVDITVTDEDGMTATCTTLVRAVVDEGLRIEMFWNTPRTDMDLHLLNPTATSWFNPNDCYYANCRSGLMWEPAGVENDPSLDIDDTDGFGPENINIQSPSPGTYRVGVHAFSGDAGVTVRIYCGGSRTDARATFGPTRLDDRSGGMNRDFWRVADIQIDGVGRCTVTELLNDAGRPDIITSGVSEGRR